MRRLQCRYYPANKPTPHWKLYPPSQERGYPGPGAPFPLITRTAGSPRSSLEDLFLGQALYACHQGYLRDSTGGFRIVCRSAGPTKRRLYGEIAKVIGMMWVAFAGIFLQCGFKTRNSRQVPSERAERETWANGSSPLPERGGPRGETPRRGREFVWVVSE